MDVWYLAHPVRDDSRFKEEENLDHAIRVQELLWKAGLVTVNPWFTYIKMFPRNNDFKLIEQCLEIDCHLIDLLGKIVLTGHRMSHGMQTEALAAKESDAEILNLIGIPDRHLIEVVQDYLMEQSSDG